MNWFDNFLKRWSAQDESFTGAILPSASDIASIPRFEETVATIAPVVWKPLELQRVPKWVQYDQGMINKCVASTKALMDSIKFYKRNNLKREVKFSDDWIYKHRSPKIPGMVGTKAIEITREIGNVFDAIFPLVRTDEEVDLIQLDEWMYEEAKVYQTSDTPILPPIKDIDTLVSIMQVTDKPLMVWFEFVYKEWQSVPYFSGLIPTIRHSVTFPPPKNAGEMTYGIYEGEKAIVIQDSWGLQYGIEGKRIIKESFFNKRNIFCQYDMRFKFDVSQTHERYDGSIISLQKVLRSLGYFPTNISYVESFGPVTKDSLKKFQLAFNLKVDGILNAETVALLKAKFN